MYIQRNRWPMNRRMFLEAAGVSLALPWLEAMGLRSGSVTNAGEMASSEIPRRAYFSNWGFFNNRYNVPKSTGKDYTLTPALKPLEPFKNDCTLFSGVLVFGGGHGSCSTLLTGINHMNNGIRLVSVDQQLAAFHQGKTRVPSLVLALGRSTGLGTQGYETLSFTANRTPIAPENRPEVVFDRLFRVDDAKGIAARKHQLAEKASILDLVKNQARSLETKLGKDDRATLDQYFTSVRDAEERINIDNAWLDRPKPKVAPLDFGKISLATLAAMKNDDGTGMRKYLRLMFDIIALAFQTDSTRVVSHFPKGEQGPTFNDVTRYHYHELTHHGEDEEKLRLWSVMDGLYMEHWAYFLGKLKSIKEGNGTLLDHTVAAWATTNGEGGHAGNKLPMILCGGAGLGLKHQGHIATKDMKVGSVWQTMLQPLGMPVPANFQNGFTDGIIKQVL
jgi:Protein of unknown function (DUF1552)